MSLDSTSHSVSSEMSVVIVTPDNYETIRKTMSHLRSQTARASLEIVIVTPSREQLGLDPSEMSVFANYDVVEMGMIVSIGQANAAGVRRATTPIVAFAEDHCFPDPDWAESLIAAHRDPWAAVGPAVRNANPRTALSWADLFIGYGPWLLPTSGREVDFLPGHNCSYKREVLLRYGDQLEAMMDAETVLHWNLRAEGFRLYLEPAARMSHTNFSLWSSWIPVQFYSGRLFAGSRARHMSPQRRLVFIAGSPLIPFVRLLRIASSVRTGGLLGQFLLCLPTLVIGLVLDGAGQMTGYTMGIGNAVDKVARFEFHRRLHITKQDRQEVFME